MIYTQFPMHGLPFSKDNSINNLIESENDSPIDCKIRAP